MKIGIVAGGSRDQDVAVGALGDLLPSRLLTVPSVSIVIPTFDEESALSALLPSVLELNAEVIVADGGSRDATAAVAEGLGAKVVRSGRGRGTQLAAGAQNSQGDILLFLHADTRLPDNALTSVREVVGEGCVGGGFSVRFDRTSPLLRLGERLINLRTRWTRVPLGDQAQFVRRDVYERLGGYRPWPILEDLDLARRLKREGSVAILPTPVVTASRRFRKRGIVRTVATNWLIWALYFLGVSPERLAGLYRDIR